MCCKFFIKRALPFLATFAVGLFIASFFVTVAAPNFQFNRGLRRHRQYDRTIEAENQRLTRENFSLKRQLTDKDTQNLNDRDFDVELAVPPPPVPPIAPAAKAQTIPYNGR